MRLCRATCPACGARNPAGVLAQQREDRQISIFTIVMLVGTTTATYFVPAIALGLLGLFLALYLHFLRKRPSWMLVLNIAVTLALGGVVWLFPRWAFLVLAVPTVQTLLRRRDPAEREEPWKRCAEELRFFDTPQRRP
jgi:hypothetical protein